MTAEGDTHFDWQATAEPDLDKLLASTGFEPTPGQRRLLEAWGQAGERTGKQIAAALNREFSAWTQSRR